MIRKRLNILENNLSTQTLRAVLSAKSGADLDVRSRRILALVCYEFGTRQDIHGMVQALTKDQVAAGKRRSKMKRPWWMEKTA
jgi:hypothetical protein